VLVIFGGGGAVPMDVLGGGGAVPMDVWGGGGAVPMDVLGGGGAVPMDVLGGGGGAEALEVTVSTRVELVEAILQDISLVTAIDLPNARTWYCSIPDTSVYQHQRRQQWPPKSV